jgi:hypothetical protein
MYDAIKLAQGLTHLQVNLEKERREYVDKFKDIIPSFTRK